MALIRYIQVWLQGLALKLLLKDFSVPVDNKLIPEEMNEAMVYLHDNAALRKYFDILKFNLMLRHTYVKDMNEKSFYSGQLFIVSQLKKKSERAYKKYQEEEAKKKNTRTTTSSI